MKVHEKQEWTLLTVFWYLIWFQRYLRLKGRNMTLKIGSLQTTTTVKILSYKINYNSIITESNPLKL